MALVTTKFLAGQSYRVHKINPNTDKSYRNRLLAMGLIPGATFEIVRKAPFGGPVQLAIAGYSLSLRAHDLASLGLEEVPA